MRKRGDRPTLRETQLRTKTHRNVPSWTNRHLPATMATPPPHDARNITNVTNSKHLRRTDSAATSCVHELDLVANDALNSSQTGKMPRALYCNNLPNIVGGSLLRPRGVPDPQDALPESPSQDSTKRSRNFAISEAKVRDG